MCETPVIYNQITRHTSSVSDAAHPYTTVWTGISFDVPLINNIST